MRKSVFRIFQTVFSIRKSNFLEIQPTLLQVLKAILATASGLKINTSIEVSIVQFHIWFGKYVKFAEVWSVSSRQLVSLRQLCPLRAEFCHSKGSSFSLSTFSSNSTFKTWDMVLPLLIVKKSNQVLSFLLPHFRVIQLLKLETWGCHRSLWKSRIRFLVFFFHIFK